MILGYRDARTERFARGERVRTVLSSGENRLVRLEAAGSLGELAALRCNRKGQWSMGINDQWRICFIWAEGALGPSEIEIVDYH